MPFKSLIRELTGVANSVGSKSRRAERKRVVALGRSHVAPEKLPISPSAPVEQGRWAELPPELLLDIISRVETTETSWPYRRDVVACAAVCKSWRKTTKSIVRTPEQCGLLTFPMSLKQPGPRDSQIQCFIKRERATSTYRLYLGLSPGDASKLLLTAKRIRRAMSTEFLISFVADDFSQASNNYLGKLRSNFLGTKFLIYEHQLPCHHGTHSCGWKVIPSKKVSSLKSVTCDYNIATISYEVNVLRTRGPRRMRCSMRTIPFSSIQEGGTAPTPSTFRKCIEDDISALSGRRENDSMTSLLDSPVPVCNHNIHPLVLRNKAPRWHEQLQCWCLNFRGRVTVASVKNFQLVAAADPSGNIPAAEQDKVILQFGKIGKDIFTMDYRYPLSAFQSFAISLSSFDTKPACE